jgi:hypothetical protein
LATKTLKKTKISPLWKKKKKKTPFGEIFPQKKPWAGGGSGKRKQIKPKISPTGANVRNVKSVFTEV